MVFFSVYLVRSLQPRLPLHFHTNHGLRIVLQKIGYEIYEEVFDSFSAYITHSRTLTHIVNPYWYNRTKINEEKMMKIL